MSEPHTPNAVPGPAKPSDRAKDRGPLQTGMTGVDVSGDAGRGSIEPAAGADPPDQRLDFFPPEEGAGRINPAADPHDTSEERKRRDTVPAPNADATDPSDAGSSATRVTTRQGG